ncbi:hypothetical protein RI578_22860 [Streptomyces sp. BB1-1-1]|uniref:hypothetical protein n=1 Tax=Streptomyces sp. BB1-1-1 TaxID=3074430 RepID=UPI002877DF0F|nr:hypothetical protein [Streptomyces sp. BB1-1-1]WND36952.1 hypothetical protein RI578_22860 [Streptomyces sp. BB1-1-1]
MTWEQLERTVSQPTPDPIPGQIAVEVERPGIPRGLAAQFTLRTREVEGGHREWSAPTKGRAGRFRHRGRDYTAYQAAFILRTGRNPDGPARPSCEHPQCCEPAHVDDGATRQRDRAALAGITGVTHRAWSCDHDEEQHARHRADGKRYCAECNRLSSKPSCEHGNPQCRDDDVRPYPCGPRCDEHQPARTLRRRTP